MADGDREVLSSLPRRRPERRSAKRDAPKVVQAKPGPKAKAKPKPRAKPAPKAAAPRNVPPAGYAVPKISSPVSAGGTELVGTAVQAAGAPGRPGGAAGGRAGVARWPPARGARRWTPCRSRNGLAPRGPDAAYTAAVAE